MLRRVVARGLDLFQASRLKRIERVSVAAEQLARMDDLDLIVARSETLARSLLPCDNAWVTLEPEAPPSATGVDGPSALRITLPAASGRRLGWITAIRRRGLEFSSDDEAVFEELARFVALSVQIGQRTAERNAAEERMATLLARLHEGVAELDFRLQFRIINEAGARHLRLGQPRDVSAINLWDLDPGRGAGQFGMVCCSAVESGSPIWTTAHFAGLHRCFDLRATPHAAGLTVLFNDVTAEREAARQLAHSRRLEAVGQLTGGLVHDVNNLLTIMLGNFETLAERAVRRKADLMSPVSLRELQEDVELAQAGLSAGESANSLIQRLLSFSHGKPGPARKVDVAASLRSLEPLLQRALLRRVRVQIHCAEPLWPVLADPAELESAILNLVLNAQDAMPQGGVIDISAENIEVDELYAAVGGFERTGQYVMLGVIDNGAGMSEDTMQHVFEPFFTTKADGQGSGLGLAMVRRFARLAGGHVLIDSAPGQGTILRIYLPRGEEMDRAVAPSAAAPSATAAASARHETILLVEDNPLLRVHGTVMLQDLGYRVTAAGDAGEALTHLRGGLHPALLFTDLTLADGMNGIALAKVAVELRPGLPVLFTSGDAIGSAIREGRLPPEVPLLRKPFRRSDLAVAVRAAIAADRSTPAPA